jgi:spore coat polysaccharide biosynthesis protein SpsF
MKKPAIAIIQARMSSTRLPGKVLKPLANKPMIWHIYNRAEHCRFVDKVVVATSTDVSDDPLVEFCTKNNMNYYRGDLNNVLSRYIEIVEKDYYPYIVRITGDCPLIHLQFIDNQIKALEMFDADITWCLNLGSAFEGQGVRSTRSLKYIAKNSNNAEDKEHVGSPFIASHPEFFRIVELCPPSGLIVEGYRLTVDEEKDYELFSRLYDSLWPQKRWIELKDAIKWLKEHPEIAKINEDVQHKRLNIEIQEQRRKWTTIKKVGIAIYEDNP